tara:strand:- start:8191 stop:8904 length:714 start_codon:yes stop_codon:yes gene_type:complete
MTSTSPQSTSRSIAITVILLLLVIAGSAAFYVQNENQRPIKAAQQKEHDAKIAQKKQDLQDIQKLFDTYLNDFKEELRVKAADYKDTRLILKDIIQPYNFETQIYAQENYTLFKTEIAPSLRQKAAEIIGVFETYDKKLETNLKDKDNDLQQTFRQEWKDMHNDQLTKYVTFFSHEEELIQAYDDLITFYYAHSKRYKVDAEKNIFIFSHKADEKKVDVLLSRLNALKNRKEEPSEK